MAAAFGPDVWMAAERASDRCALRALESWGERCWDRIAGGAISLCAQLAFPLDATPPWCACGVAAARVNVVAALALCCNPSASGDLLPPIGAVLSSPPTGELCEGASAVGVECMASALSPSSSPYCCTKADSASNPAVWVPMHDERAALPTAGVVARPLADTLLTALLCCGAEPTGRWLGVRSLLIWGAASREAVWRLEPSRTWAILAGASESGALPAGRLCCRERGSMALAVESAAAGTG